MSQYSIEPALTTYKVFYGNPATQTVPFQLSYTSDRPFEDVVESLRHSIQTAGLRLLHEIDPQKAVEGAGRSMAGSRLLFFFHPELVVRVLEADWSAMVEAPLKLLVTELPGERVSVRMHDPAAAFGRYGNRELATLGSELAQQCRKIVESSI